MAGTPSAFGEADRRLDRLEFLVNALADVAGVPRNFSRLVDGRPKYELTHFADEAGLFTFDPLVARLVDFLAPMTAGSMRRDCLVQYRTGREAPAPLPARTWFHVTIDKSGQAVLTSTMPDAPPQP